LWEHLASLSRDIVLVLAGYYNGKRNNTIIEPQKIKNGNEEVCNQHRETTLPSRTCSALTNEFTKP